jgi:hypothetical protein
MGPGPDRPVPGWGRGRLLGRLCAGIGLPQTVDRLGQRGKLLRQASRVRLLGGEQPPDRLQLILHHLQLIDRFLLGRLEALGLFDQLLGGLRRPRLQLPHSGEPLRFRRWAGIDPPQRDRGRAHENDEEGDRSECDRLRADRGSALGVGVAREMDHEMQSPGERNCFGEGRWQCGMFQRGKRRRRWKVSCAASVRREAIVQQQIRQNGGWQPPEFPAGTLSRTGIRKGQIEGQIKGK